MLHFIPVAVPETHTALVRTVHTRLGIGDTLDRLATAFAESIWLG